MRYLFKTAELMGDSFELNFYATSKEDAIKKLTRCVELTWIDKQEPGLGSSKSLLNNISNFDVNSITSIAPIRI